MLFYSIKQYLIILSTSFFQFWKIDCFVVDSSRLHLTVVDLQNQLLMFHLKTLKNIWSWSRWNRTHKLWNTCVVPFMIAEFYQKCLEAAATLKYEPLNSCITVLSVWIIKIYVNVMLLIIIMNTFSPNKRGTNCEESTWWSQSAFVWPLAMSCLDANISLVPCINS